MSPKLLPNRSLGDPWAPKGRPSDPEDPPSVEDTDGDGVPNVDDLCSGTEPGAVVWSEGEWSGCAGGQFRDVSRPDGPDADGDGIEDTRDRCSDTLAGAPVWSSGEWSGCAGGQFRDR